MLTKTWNLGRIFGVDVKIHRTFGFLLAFLAISGVLKDGLLGALLSVGLTLVIFSVILLHEFGHIWAARFYGIQTKDIILSPIGGMARLKANPKKPSQEIIVAIAGPAINAILAGITAVGLHFIPSASLTPVGSLSLELGSWFLTVNLFLLAFNLIPALPMDGGRVLRAALAMKMGHLKATETAARVARWTALAMAIYGIFSGQFMLLILAFFVFLFSGFELFQARFLGGGNGGQNPIFSQAFKHATQGQTTRQSPMAGVVDQNGNPVMGDSQWNVKEVRWADKS